MVAEAGGGNVLLASQPVGPAVDALCSLARQRPEVTFGCLVDNAASLTHIEAACAPHETALTLYVDLDVGMHRTGIAPGDAADKLYRSIHESGQLAAGGIHAYDGHIHDSAPAERRRSAARTRNLAQEMRQRLIDDGMQVPEIVLGGTPSFPCHAEAWEPGITLSPGTYVYFDWGYARRYADLPFEMAAVVFGRVISVPVPGRFTVDIGSKAIAADPEQPRGLLLNIPQAEAGPQSEEHWVFTVPNEVTPAVGDPVYAWPWHICPTIEHYDTVAVISDDGSIEDWWAVNARGRNTYEYQRADT